MPERTSADDDLCARIVAWADNQGLNAGSRLPAERILAPLFGVSRTTLNRALLALITRGVIRQESREIRTWVGERDTLSPGTVIIVSSAIIHPMDKSLRCGLAGIHQGAVDELRRRGLRSLTIDLPSFLTRPLPRVDPRGVLILPGLGQTDARSRDDLFAAIQRLRIPSVLFADDFAAKHLSGCHADVVMTDHAAGAELLVRHLHARGRRRIRVCLHREFNQGRPRIQVPWVTARIAGWSRACTALGLPQRPPLDLIGAPHSATQSEFDDEVRLSMGCLAEALRDDERPDGLLAVSDGMAFPIAAACRRLGVIPGRDIDIVGYDHQAHLSFMQLRRANEPTIPHASIELDPERIGAAMVTIWSRRAAGSLPSTPLREVLPVRLITRVDTPVPAWNHNARRTKRQSRRPGR